MNAHLFTADKGSKVCTECGKTRNAKAHKDAKDALAAQVQADVEMEAAMDEEAAELGNQVDAEATTVAEAREDLLPEVDAQVDDAEVADALEAAGVEVADEEPVAEETKPEPAKKATPAKAKADGVATASLWVGWRITNAAVLADSTLAAKLKAAKPTGDLDRTVRLTAEELAELDAIAAGFMTPGHTGPEIYSGRALRGRIAAALAKIEAVTKENDK